MRKLLFVLALLCGSAWAQGSFYTLTQPLPNATLRVCPVGTANPCPTPSSIFSDGALTQPIVQPVQLGPSGNFGFYIASGQYTIQVAQPYNQSFNITVNGSGITPVTVNGFGSSIIAGTGNPTPSTQNFLAMTCAVKGWANCVNNGINGAGVADQITSINGTIPGAGTINVFETVTNDNNAGGTSASYQAQYQAALLYALVSMGLPEQNKYWSDNAAITYAGGSWTDTTILGRHFRFTNTVNATATATINGSVVYVGFLTQAANNATMSVKVDGVTYYASIGAQSANASPLSSSNWPYAVRVGGLYPVNHTVVVTYASGTNNDGIFFIAGNGGLTSTSVNAYSPSGPSTYVLNGVSCCSQTNQGPYANIVASIVSQLAADEMNVMLVDSASAYNPSIAAEVNVPNANHPSLVGQQVIATALQNALTPYATPFDRAQFAASPPIGRGSKVAVCQSGGTGCGSTPGDFTDANSAALQAIPGLTYPFGVLAGTYSFHCSLMYSQATNVAGDQLGVAVLTTAPTNLSADSTVITNTGVAPTFGVLTGLTTTTPTAIVTFQPAVATVLGADIDGSVEVAGGNTATLQLYVLNGTAADVIVIKRESYCSIY